MESSKIAKKGKNSHKDEFNYYQDLDQRIDTLMKELRAVRAVTMQRDDTVEIGETNTSKIRKPNPRNT